jgi:hypothetical protein
MTERNLQASLRPTPTLIATLWPGARLRSSPIKAPLGNYTSRSLLPMADHELNHYQVRHQHLQVFQDLIKAVTSLNWSGQRTC